MMAELSFKSNQHGTGAASPRKEFSPKLADSASLCSNLLVIKISGKLCDSEAGIAKLAAEVGALVERGSKVVLVHGGGKQIDAALAQAGIATEKKGGIRITSEEAMGVIGQVVSGINSGLVSAFAKAGLQVAGIDGVESSVIAGKPHAMRTGDVEGVDFSALSARLRSADVVVLSCLGKDGAGLLNINADAVAEAVSVAAKAKKLVLLSDVGGVFSDLKDAGTLLHTLTQADVEALVKAGSIEGGMIPKATACIHAVQKGVGEVVLAAGSVSLSGIISGSEAECTRFVGSSPGMQ
jgi:acetylglutamate kinase